MVPGEPSQRSERMGAHFVAWNYLKIASGLVTTLPPE